MTPEILEEKVSEFLLATQISRKMRCDKRGDLSEAEDSDLINLENIADVTDKLIETVAEDNVAEPNLKSVKFSRIYFCFEK